MQRYRQVRYLREEGVAGFHRDLMLWAGQLAQFPDSYSFKRRFLNGLPVEHQHHLALFEGITPEHSSITDIVLRARRLEKTLIFMRSGRMPDRYSAQSPVTALAAADTSQGTTIPHTSPREAAAPIYCAHSAAPKSAPNRGTESPTAASTHGSRICRTE
jgi:hypothetical protein